MESISERRTASRRRSSTAGVVADIFISYTHRDNAKLSDEQQGWVDRFHEALEMRLTSLWGQHADIWRDLKTAGSDVLDAAIEKQVAEASILVTVLSPGYIRSDWCTKELGVFCDAAEKGAGLHVGTRSRVVKVVKTPVEHNVGATHAALAESVGYPFFRLDERGVPLEFDVRFGERARQQFLGRVNELAYDICAMLEKLTGKSAGRVAPPSGSRVYLAESTSDLTPFTEQLRRELEQYGHTVLPEQPFAHASDYVVRVAESLQEADLSIHPVGASYGVIPEGERRSVLELQYDLAGREGQARPEMTRIPWMLPGTAGTDERLAAFAASLQDDPQLLITSLDSLKMTVADLLASKKAAPVGAALERAPAILVYLIADRCDAAASQACEDALFAGGCEVIAPLSSGSESELRLDHEENLKSCDAIAIYHGATTEFWLRTKLRDLQKAFGYGRTRPFLATAVVLAPPDMPDKRRFRSNEVLVINALDGYQSGRLQPFFDRVASSRRVS